MASPIVFVSLLMAVSLSDSSAVTNTIARDGPSEIKSHKWDALGDEQMAGRHHFAEFLRALYAPQKDVAVANEMPNELMPISSLGDEHDINDEFSQDPHQEFPTDGSLIPILQKRQSRYCGSYLADALQLACQSSYLPLFGKRSTGNNVLDATTGSAPTAAWPFISSDKAHSVLSNPRLFHRHTRGVHDECCIKGCNYKELTAYCTGRK